MKTQRYKPVEQGHWNACIELLCRPLETLDAIQRPAALAFHYDGRVMNGGHSLHFDFRGDSSDEELLQALKTLGATEQARILIEASLLWRQADHGNEDERENAAESIEVLDRRFYRLRPDINEFLARYFHAHPESFLK